MKRRQFVATLSGLTAALVAAPFVINGSENLEGHATLLYGSKGWWLTPLDGRKLHVGDHVYMDLRNVTYNRPGLPGIQAATFRVWAVSSTREAYRILPIENVYWVRRRQVAVEKRVKYQVVQTAYAEEWDDERHRERIVDKHYYRKFPYIPDEMGKVAFA